MFDLKNLTLAQAEGDAAPQLPSGSNPTQPSVNETTLTNQPVPSDQNNQDKPKSLFNDPSMLIIIVVMALFFLFMMRSQRKEKKKRQQMIDSVKKNTKVVTVGGILGTVVELKENEVVLKVDESSNTRMRFNRSAIQGVISTNND